VAAVASGAWACAGAPPAASPPASVATAAGAPAPVGAPAVPSPAPPEPFVWRWVGTELVGTRDTPRDAILARLAVPVGEPYAKEVAARLAADCAALAEPLSLLAVRCAPLRKTGEGAYLVVDVVERSEPERLASTPAPAGDVALPAELADAYRRLEEGYTERLMAGRPVPESADAGYLDFADPELHAIALELLAAVPPHRDLLLRAVAEDRDAADRARAATLLHWVPDKPAAIAAVHRLLDDSDETVRNDVSRFMLFHLGRVEDRALLREVVVSLARQLARPSHGDRNKALYGLGAVLDAAPELAPFVEERAGPWLRRLAEQSVLSNVGGVAVELLARLQGADRPAAPPG
jgi:hypothetical protein